MNVFAPSAVPEFRAIVGNEAAEELQCSVGDVVHTRLALKNCFTRMMNCEKKVFVDQLNMLVKRVTEEGEEYENRFYTTSAEPEEGKVAVCSGAEWHSGLFAQWSDIRCSLGRHLTKESNIYQTPNNVLLYSIDKINNKMWY